MHPLWGLAIRKKYEMSIAPIVGFGEKEKICNVKIAMTLIYIVDKGCDAESQEIMQRRRKNTIMSPKTVDVLENNQH